MTVGIYCLYFESDDAQFYIGKSTCIEYRFKEHCSMLVKGTHYNKALSNNYKGILPSLSILEKCSSASLLNCREIHWINVFDSFNNGMNETTGGDGASFGEANQSALYTKDKYVQILLFLANTAYDFKEIARILEVEYNVVKQLALGASHQYLELEYPTEYSAMLSKVGTRKHGPSPAHTKDTYANILHYLANTEDTLESISIRVGVPISIVKDISRGVSHVYLKKQYPEVYRLLEQKRSARKIGQHGRPRLLSPEGQVFSVEVGSIALFARTHGLNHSHICGVLNGKRKTHKGWKVYGE